MLAPSQKRCLNGCIDKCNEARPTLEWLEQVVKVAPQYKDRVEELRDMLDHVETVSRAGLAAAGETPR